MRLPVVICLCVASVTVLAVPIPDDSKINSTETSTTTETPTSSTTEPSSSTTEAEYSPPQLKVIDDEKHDETPAASDIIGDEHNHEKRHHPTPSPEELEERRQAFIKALGGNQDEDGGGGGGVLTAGLSGLGSLATDAVTLLTANANETFAPLREATAKAKQNFPNIGTTVNNFVRNGRAYAGRAYRGLAKNLRVKITNALRFMLAGVTRLASTVGGLYNVVVSLLDVATRGLTAGAGVGARVLSVGANRTASALAAGTSLLNRITGAGLLRKPFNQAISTGDMFFKGVSEDIYDKFEWTNEGILSKVNLAQAIAPNFLLHAHENVNLNTGNGGGGEPEGGYSIHGGEDDPTLLSLATNAAELMLRGGREVEGTSSTSSTTTTTEESVSSSTTATESTTRSSSESSTIESSSTDKMSARSDNDTVGVPPQDLLNDIFGLQMEINDLKNTTTNSTNT